jgi:hypothetical protein
MAADLNLTDMETCNKAFRPNVTRRTCDLTRTEDFEDLRGRFDTVVCLNVVEHVEDDLLALRNIRSALKPGDGPSSWRRRTRPSMVRSTRRRFNGQILKRESFGRFQLRVFDLLVPVWKGSTGCCLGRRFGDRHRRGQVGPTARFRSMALAIHAPLPPRTRQHGRPIAAAMPAESGRSVTCVHKSGTPNWCRPAGNPLSGSFARTGRVPD